MNIMSKNKKIFLSNLEISKNINSLKFFLKNQKLDGFYISSSDIFLNEYVPLEDCHRYYLSGFTGSTAELLVTAKHGVYLFVDGRYFEQADNEVDSKLVNVVKVPFGANTLVGALKEKIKELGDIFVLGIEGDRTAYALKNDFAQFFEVKSFNNEELYSIISFQRHKLLRPTPIKEIPFNLVGEETSSKLARILKPGEAYYVTALDSIAWLLNLRSYEMPNQSTFKSRAFVTYDRAYLLLEEGRVEDAKSINNSVIEIAFGSFNQPRDFIEQILITELWQKLSSKSQNKKSDLSLELFSKVYCDSKTLTACDAELLLEVFGESKVEMTARGLTLFHAIKNQAEMKAMEASFALANRAIYKTISWAKKSVSENKSMSELDFYHMTDEFYREEGAFEQSFKTIAAAGSNSSIIHFSSPSESVSVQEGMLMLLDSGGYFESGYATDTTRAFLSGGQASPKQKEIYTLVLKSLLTGLNAVFPENTWGSAIDGMIRAPLFLAGYNYNHGTGHGVGINVHEGGFSLSTKSGQPILENTVGSIEPGIYLPGIGGVRLENVVVVEKHPTHQGMLRFRSLVFVGFDWDLIDESLLSSQEKKWLDEYEAECARQGTSFKIGPT